MLNSHFSEIFQNEDFLIIDKSTGITFEGEDGVLAALRAAYGEVYGIHRLDKETSGLMIFAKSKETQKKISELFAFQGVQKLYLALSDRKPKKKMGMIKGDLEKRRGGSYGLARTTKNPSITKFCSFYLEAKKLRLFILKPVTGKTHQLRVHLKSLGSPIIGDSRYSGTESDRMYLACISLEFEYMNQSFSFFKFPTTGELFDSDLEGTVTDLVKEKGDFLIP